MATIQGPLKILFWNIRSAKQRKNELQEILQNIDVLVCVESWLKPKDLFQVPGFVAYRQNREIIQGGGILLLVRKNIKFINKSLFSVQIPNVEIAGIRFTNTNPTFDLIACYKIPGNTLTQTEWNAITDCLDNNFNSILVGDFNSHN